MESIFFTELTVNEQETLQGGSGFQTYGSPVNNNTAQSSASASQAQAQGQQAQQQGLLSSVTGLLK